MNETPDYNDFTERLKTLKQHFSFENTKVKILEGPVILAKKVRRQDTLLREMVDDMQRRIARFNHGMSRVEPEHKD